MAQRYALLDLNGDGVEEQIVAPIPPAPASGGDFDLILSGTSPPVRQRFRSNAGVPSRFIGTAPIGDVNVDGFGDLALSEFLGPYVRHKGFDLRVKVYLGAPSGAREPPQVLRAPAAVRPSDRVTVFPVGDVNGDGFGDAHVQWYVTPASGQFFVGGAEERVVRDNCVGLSMWFDHGDLDADGYEEVVTVTSSYGTWSFAFLVLPGGPDTARNSRCGEVARSSAEATPLRTPEWMRGRVLDANDDGYDDVLLRERDIFDWVFQLFRGGPAGVPFTLRTFGP